MAKGFKGPGMGRPEIDWNKEKVAMFETLMGIEFITCETISDIMKVSPISLVRWLKKTYGVTFDDLKAIKRQGMKSKLAGKQYQMAMNGNATMAIWLGKQWLGQTDKVENKNFNIEGLSDSELDKKIAELEASRG